MVSSRYQFTNPVEPVQEAWRTGGEEGGRVGEVKKYRERGD